MLRTTRPASHFVVTVDEGEREPQFVLTEKSPFGATSMVFTEDSAREVIGCLLRALRVIERPLDDRDFEDELEPPRKLAAVR